MTHTKPMFLQLKLLTLKELYLYQIGLLMFKIVIVHKMHVPKHINDYFNVNADFHNYIPDMHPYYRYHLPLLA